MKRLAPLLLVALSCSPALAHFVFIAPSENQSEAQVVFSETPAPDEKVVVDKIVGTKLFATDDQGRETPLPVTRTSNHYLTAKLPSPAPLVLRGETDYGVTNSRHTGNIPVLIKYYAKAVLANPQSLAPFPHRAAVIEIVPTVNEGRLTFTAYAAGKPLADSDCVVKAPGDEKGERSKTNAAGALPGQFDKPGRYAVWVRQVDLTPGEVNGSRYDKAHNYGTLVIDLQPAK